jgi:hypothetical protein
MSFWPVLLTCFGFFKGVQLFEVQPVEKAV